MYDVRIRTFLEEFRSCRFVYGTVHCPIDLVRKSPIITVLEPQSLYQIHTSTSAYIKQGYVQSKGVRSQLQPRQESCNWSKTKGKRNEGPTQKPGISCVDDRINLYMRDVSSAVCQDAMPSIRLQIVGFPHILRYYSLDRYPIQHRVRERKSFYDSSLVRSNS